jgi:hypothetical protein
MRVAASNTAVAVRRGGEEVGGVGVRWRKRWEVRAEVWEKVGVVGS